MAISLYDKLPTNLQQIKNLNHLKTKLKSYWLINVTIPLMII